VAWRGGTGGGGGVGGGGGGAGGRGKGEDRQDVEWRKDQGYVVCK